MRQTEEDKTKKFHGSRTFIARRPFTRPWDGSHGRHGGYSDGRTKPTESIRQSVKSSKPSLPSPPFPSLPPPPPLIPFLFAACARKTMRFRVETFHPATNSKRERRKAEGARGRGREREVETIARERSCRFSPVRASSPGHARSGGGGEAGGCIHPTGIASSAAHNPAVMAFDSYDCSDNCTGNPCHVFRDKFRVGR